MLFITEGSQDKNSNRVGADAEGMEGWRGAAYWLASLGLLSLLSCEPRTSNLRMATPTMGWVLPIDK